MTDFPIENLDDLRAMLVIHSQVCRRPVTGVGLAVRHLLPFLRSLDLNDLIGKLDGLTPASIGRVACDVMDGVHVEFLDGLRLIALPAADRKPFAFYHEGEER